MKVAFIGLGAKGSPMAGHIQQAGHNVTVYNRTTQKAKDWVAKYSGSYASTPSEAAVNADIVLICVGNDDDVREVVYGKHGAMIQMPRDSILVDHTTTSAHLSRELHDRAKQNGIHFLDAPVSGGQAGAENGKLIGL